MNTFLVMQAAKPKLLTGGEKLSPAVPARNASLKHGLETESSPLYTIEEIRIRAEIMTPFLRSILDFKPSPHWGIN